MSKEKKVITIKGEELLISKCKKFNKLWYKIGNSSIEESGDCYLIGDKYFRVETKAIVYNHSVKSYVIQNSDLIFGVVSVVEEKTFFGHFENDKQLSLIIEKEGNSYLLFDENQLKNNRHYRENLSDGNFYHINLIRATEFNKIKKPSQEYKNSLPYDSKGIIESNLKKYEKNCNAVVSDVINNYSKLLQGLSFGLEFETIAGFVPNRILDANGLIPLRDGSISGIEYVTVPLKGEKGLQSVVNMLEPLKNRTKYDDETCSLHLHLGNVPRTKEFILAFVKLTMLLQDEIYTMFPLYKKYNMGVKNKNYSEQFPVYKLLNLMDPVINSLNINQNFNVIYKYLSMGPGFDSVGNDLKNVDNHPADLNGNQKWNVKTRYLIHNLIPLIFGNKKTIEFRIHTPTYDVYKIIPFILMNSLIVNFAIKYEKNILQNPSFLNGFSLFKVLSYQIENSVELLNKKKLINMFSEYISTRKGFTQEQIRSGNITGLEENIPATRTIDWKSTSKDLKSEEKLEFIKSPSTIKFRNTFNDLNNEKKSPISEINSLRSTYGALTFNELKQSISSSIASSGENFENTFVAYTGSKSYSDFEISKNQIFNALEIERQNKIIMNKEEKNDLSPF